MSHEGVAFINQDRFNGRQHVRHFVEHGCKGICLTQFGEFFFVEFLGVEHAGEKSREESHLFPEPCFAPGSQQGCANLSVDQLQVFPQLLRCCCRCRQFCTRFDARL